LDLDFGQFDFRQSAHAENLLNACSSAIAHHQIRRRLHAGRGHAHYFVAFFHQIARIGWMAKPIT
jgi:hypothetical protein